MAKEDEEKTAFHTSQGVFCYIMMPFGLKNAGSTYQRLVDKAFDHHIGRNLKIYIDDLVMKSQREEEVVRDIAETFRTLRKINMKLNPKKCTFEATEGTFLGHTISKNGIQACSEKAQAVVNMPSPRTLKEVQSLNGKLASLNRFLSKAVEKSLPFFKTLKRCIKKSDFVWTEEVKKALQEMKKQMAELPTLTAQIEGETLIMYMSAAEEAVSVVLLAKRGEKQTLIYFVGKALQSPKVNHSPMEKLVLALPRTSVKGKILADFLAELPAKESGGGSEAGLILTNPTEVKFTYALRFEFKASNNEAEYEALLAGLRIAEKISVKHIEAFVDSKLVANQINDMYHEIEETMQKYLSKAKELIAHFETFSITQISGNKGNATKVLLANHAHGRSNGDQSMQRMPGAQAGATFAKDKAEDYHITLAIPQVRDRYLWPVPRSSRQGMPSLRCSMVDKNKNDEVLLLNLDLLEEKREPAAIAEDKHKRKTKGYYNSKVRSTTLKPEDLVYRNNEASKQNDMAKLGPKWEGPYEVTEAIGDGAYKLRDQEVNQLPQIWNIADLKRWYI
ncbi:reverse transcriptase domain-containing protein [Tanacetum coccineum]|uniref:Reverse transcriptase domain-containing protein n=1 Tax=Tanacetum coccineum TaxID=301880 RepID=A0ABQ4YQ44_9ASTR